MIEKRNIADVLETMLNIAKNHYDGIAFRSNSEDDCIFCYINPDQTAHELWCAWELGRHLSQSDITAVERLVRVLRYEV